MYKTLGIIGGGPAALLTFKRLVNSGMENLRVVIYEATDKLGSGMPYSALGAKHEHVTNVSADELPELGESLSEWISQCPDEILQEFGVDKATFHEKMVVPRLLFGQYLCAQFQTLLDAAHERNLETSVLYNTKVIDIRDCADSDKVVVTSSIGEQLFDYVVISTGHHWIVDRERTVPGYFDSPYPPSKLAAVFDHEVVIRGSSLTAVDAIRTLARNNGCFEKHENRLRFLANADAQNFRIEMHSKRGLLPCIRVHMEEPHAVFRTLISAGSIERNIELNDGFLELDFLFEQGFKVQLKESDPKFHDAIKDMNLELFVETMLSYREAIDPFDLFEKEYREANDSIRKERPVYWKEMLSSLSFALNYPAKYLSAEDMLRLQKHLLPLISIVIAFLPQGSCEEILALHKAGRLDLIADGDGAVKISDDSTILYHYQNEEGNWSQKVCQTFIDCIGQKHLSLDMFPFRSLVKDGSVSQARLRFRSAAAGADLLATHEEGVQKEGHDYFLCVSGVNISDSFQIVDKQGKANERIYLMAVPYMGGFNPDYSGLDFCEKASELIVSNILKTKCEGN